MNERDTENKIIKLGDFGFSTITYTAVNWFYKRKVDKLLAKGASVWSIYNESTKTGYINNSYGYGFKLNEKLYNYIKNIPGIEWHDVFNKETD